MSKWVELKPKSKMNSNKDLLSRLCNIREIDKKDVASFLNPDESVLFPATDFKNGLKVAERIKQAIDNEENIVVSMDNDADGVTATAIMMRYLKDRSGLGYYNSNYIFAERDWGHGIKEQLAFKDGKDERNENAERNRELIEEADLLIIVDSSSNDVSTCKKIIEKYKTDIVILDHHEINDNEETMEDVGVMLVNPQQKGCNYINKSLSGAGVVFKIVGLVEELYGDGLIDVEEYIDLAGTGLYADMMDMSILENRYIVGKGLMNIRNMGLERILKSAKQDLNKLNGDSIGFTIAPLINGTARMGNIQDAILLLLSDEDKEVKKIRLRMDKANKARREMQKELVEELTENIDDSGKMIFVITDKSSSGLNGLIAQDISQKYQKPAFVGRLYNGKISGSARSYNNIKLKSFFTDSNLVNFASGHEGALGIEFEEEKFDDILTYVEENMIDSGVVEKTFFYNVHLEPEETSDAIDLLESFNHITGTNCNKIMVRIDDLMVEERKVLGDNKNTIKFKTSDEIDLIKFRVNEDYASDVEAMDYISIIGELRWNEWTQFYPKPAKVHKTMQIMMQDYRAEDE